MALALLTGRSAGQPAGRNAGRTVRRNVGRNMARDAGRDAGVRRDAGAQQEVPEFPTGGARRRAEEHREGPLTRPTGDSAADNTAEDQRLLARPQ